ncbi:MULTISPECIES: hypothetical protein [Chryseobacterium]|uniref:Uncharacterized protein n=1 Tax=Chryseobacterium geocarposphaerae TaxID=1416776 RepID=A0A2M9C0Y5_9FLAO|nr:MULTISPECIES: hypothetical protein [Chryseobacterium]PJJ64082.1 hypothetical protein CLV73_2437 [Chryseobacterium geocarposphaerae]UMQ40109.1 hypothetical protein MKS83_11930 [Chryseobacterium sp. Y16C]
MKKFFPLLLLAFVSLFIFSCDDNDNNNAPYQDNDTYSQMRDVTGSFNSGNNYAFTQGINIQSTDVVLVYRKANNAWQQLPYTWYLDPSTSAAPRKFDYNFVFDSQNVQIRIDNPNFSLSTMSSTEVGNYLNNQTFRIVLVPASPAKGAAATVDYSDYNAVVKYYNLDESKVIKTKVN